MKYINIFSLGMLFIDDIILINEIRKSFSSKLDVLREAVESCIFEINRFNSKYVVCGFNNKRKPDKGTINVVKE